MMDVAVDHSVGSMRSQDTLKIVRVSPRPRQVQAGDDLRAKGADFIVVGAGIDSVDKEVDPEAVAVNVAQHMHQPGLDSAPIHGADDLEDADPLGSFRGATIVIDCNSFLPRTDVARYS